VTKFLNLLAAGLTSGAIYAIFAACVTLWYRVSNLLNFAVGDFAMIGAIGTALLVQDQHLPFVVAVIIVLVAVALIAWLFDVGVLHYALDRSSRGARVVAVFFYTFGLSLVLEGIARALFGTDVYAAPPIWGGSASQVLDFHIQHAGVLTIALAAIVGVGLWAYLRFTVSGKAVSACGESSLGARIVGISSGSLRRRIFILTAVLAALFGVVESPVTGFVYNSGPSISLIGVVAAGFAAYNKPGRAVLAGLGIGVAEALLGGYVSTQYNDVILYAALFVIIIMRPEILGLGAESDTVGVTA
jgi:branched-chain amino acid transport system permease protein